MTPAPVVITAAPDTLLVIAAPDVIDRLAVIANALIEAHANSGAGDCAAAGKCLRRYPPPPDDAPALPLQKCPAPQPPDTPPPDDADTDTDTDTDGNDAGNDAGGSADLTSSGKLRCIALTNTGKRCMRARNAGQSYCTFHINLPARQPAATPPTPAPAPLANDAGAGASVATAEAHTAPDRAPADGKGIPTPFAPGGAPSANADTDGNDTGANSGAGLCAAIAKVSGNRCRRLANAGTRYCHYHTPPPPPPPPQDVPDTPAPDTPTQPDTPAAQTAPLPPQQAAQTAPLLPQQPPQTAPLPDGDGNDAGNDAGAGAGAGVAPWVIAAAGCQQPNDCLQPDCLSYRTGQCRPDGIPGHLRRQPPTGTTPAPATTPAPTATATPAATTPAPAPPVGATPAPTGTPAATAGATATAGPSQCPHCGASPAMRQRDGDGHLRCLACARYWDPPALSADEAADEAAAGRDRAGYHRAALPRVAAD